MSVRCFGRVASPRGCGAAGFAHPRGVIHAGGVIDSAPSAPAEVRAWLRAPLGAFAAEFASSGAFGQLTFVVRASSGRLDLHLWSDQLAGVHRARVRSGTVRLLDLTWEPQRFRLAAARPFIRDAGAWLHDRWHPATSAPALMPQVAAFVESARERVAERARFSADAVTRHAVVTQEYAPRLRSRLDDAAIVGTVRDALVPAPVAGGEPFFSAAPDAVVLAPDGRLGLLRTYSARAPELRLAAAQAVIDLALLTSTPPNEAIAQLHHFDQVCEVRRALGLRAPERGADASRAPHAIVAVAENASARSLDQFEAVRSRLVERGLLDPTQLALESV